MNMAAILSGITYTHIGQAEQVLSDIDLNIVAGESVAVIGPSGAGKTTLLALIDGRLQGWDGAAIVLGRTLSATEKPARETRADVGFIFQEFALIDRASARQNVLNGRLGRAGNLLSLFGRFSDADNAAVDAALCDAGIADLADRRADQLSGGQRQRVAIARCLAQEPKLILADEPVSNLDPARAEAILRLITAQAKKRGAGVAFTSHQPELALDFADRVIGLVDGRIVLNEAAAKVGSRQIDQIYHGNRSSVETLRLVV